MFPRFAIQEVLFPEAKCVSSMQRKDNIYKIVEYLLFYIRKFRGLRFSITEFIVWIEKWKRSI